MQTAKSEQKFLTNNKILDALAVAMHPQTRLCVFEGTIRSAKTVTAIIALHYRIQASGAKFHLIAGRNLDTIRRNILKAELGLLSMFPGRYEEKRDAYGATFIRANCQNGVKEIILCGYADKTRWENITGGSIENVFLDEANLADEQFVNETFARQLAALNPWTAFTLNGDDPQHFIYQNYVNHCRIIGDCPASTRADMDKAEKLYGYRYMFFSYRNNPAMTEMMSRRADKQYPIGSYYHKTRILGERGTWGEMIFTDYMNGSLLVNLDEKDERGRPKYEITSYGIGVDIGHQRAYNVFALLGFDKTFSYAYVIDVLAFESKSPIASKNGYQYKTEMLRGFLTRHQGKPIEYVSVDNAEDPFINDLRGQAATLGLSAKQIIPSYKATIKERIDMNITLFATGRLRFDVKGGILAYNAYSAAKWEDGKAGEVREDKGLMLNDIMDAVEYAETRYMTALTTGKGREKK